MERERGNSDSEAEEDGAEESNEEGMGDIDLTENNTVTEDVEDDDDEEEKKE